MLVKCEDCGEIFEYEKKYSYIRRFCDKCGKNHRNNIEKLQVTGKYIRLGRENGNYKGKVKLNCEICKKEFWVIPALEDTRRFCSRKCCNVWRSLNFRGENNPKYVDGRRCDDYGSEFTTLLKEQIRERDGRVCQKCDMIEEKHKILTGQRLVIHHIDYDKKNNDEANLISLCTCCHNSICNSNKDFFLNFYQEKINEKGETQKV
jgi:uncharacterized C2H2 Zn-finger protein